MGFKAHMPGPGYIQQMPQYPGQPAFGAGAPVAGHHSFGFRDLFSACKNAFVQACAHKAHSLFTNHDMWRNNPGHCWSESCMLANHVQQNQQQMGHHFHGFRHAYAMCLQQNMNALMNGHYVRKSASKSRDRFLMQNGYQPYGPEAFPGQQMQQMPYAGAQPFYPQGHPQMHYPHHAPVYQQQMPQNVHHQPKRGIPGAKNGNQNDVHAERLKILDKVWNRALNERQPDLSGNDPQQYQDWAQWSRYLQGLSLEDLKKVEKEVEEELDNEVQDPAKDEQQRGERIDSPNTKTAARKTADAQRSRVFREGLQRRGDDYKKQARNNDDALEAVSEGSDTAVEDELEAFSEGSETAVEDDSDNEYPARESRLENSKKGQFAQKSAAAQKSAPVFTGDKNLDKELKTALDSLGFAQINMNRAMDAGKVEVFTENPDLVEASLSGDQSATAKMNALLAKNEHVIKAQAGAVLAQGALRDLIKSPRFKGTDFGAAISKKVDEAYSRMLDAENKAAAAFEEVKKKHPELDDLFLKKGTPEELDEADKAIGDILEQDENFDEADNERQAAKAEVEKLSRDPITSLLMAERIEAEEKAKKKNEDGEDAEPAVKDEGVSQAGSTDAVEKPDENPKEAEKGKKTEEAKAPSTLYNMASGAAGIASGAAGLAGRAAVGTLSTAGSVATTVASTAASATVGTVKAPFRFANWMIGSPFGGSSAEAPEESSKAVPQESSEKASEKS